MIKKRVVKLFIQIVQSNCCADRASRCFIQNPNGKLKLGREKIKIFEILFLPARPTNSPKWKYHNSKKCPFDSWTVLLIFRYSYYIIRQSTVALTERKTRNNSFFKERKKVKKINKPQCPVFLWRCFLMLSLDKLLPLTVS